MADGTKIEWATTSWNPIRAIEPGGRKGWHCEPVTDACRNCYSGTMNAWRGTRLDFNRRARDQVHHTLDEAILRQPLKWRKARTIFVCSMTDVFGPWVLDAWIDRILAVAALCPQHTFILLTKRHARMRDYLGPRATLLRVDKALVHLAGLHHPDPDAIHFAPLQWPLPNVIAMVSIHDQPSADAAIPDLLATPAAIRGISGEPLLGPVDLTGAWHGETALDAECWGDCAWCRNGHPPLYNCQRGQQSDVESWRGRSGLDWVITGGESGRNARPSHRDWFRSLRDQCQAAGVAYFHKQNGEWVDYSQIGAASWTNAASLSVDGRRARFPRARGASMGVLSDCRGEEMFDGRAFPTKHWLNGDDVCLVRVGKRRAGRKLDGRTWDEMPNVR